MKENDPISPVLRWFGGKWNLAPWIISYFPPHRVYVEPFGGAASVLLRKSPSTMEVYNDRDGGVVNMFRVLRNPVLATRLIDKLNLTPFSRQEFELGFKHSDDPVERARRLIVVSIMGFLGNRNAKTGFRGIRSCGVPDALIAWKNYPGRLPFIIERLRDVIIEDQDALDLMLEHDSNDTLHYVDPPYILRHKGENNIYSRPYTRSDHERLLEIVLKLKGAVVLSGYSDDLYEDFLIKWNRVTTTLRSDEGSDRIEVLWMNKKVSTLRTGYLF